MVPLVTMLFIQGDLLLGPVVMWATHGQSFHHHRRRLSFFFPLLFLDFQMIRMVGHPLMWLTAHHLKHLYLDI